VAKFPTEVEQSVTVQVPLAKVYKHLWDVVGSACHIPGLASCERVAKDTYRFTYDEKTKGPVKLVVRYTVHYAGNGVDEISFEGIGAEDDNTDASGTFRLKAQGDKATRIALRQMVAPDVPIPRLMQSLIKPFVEREAADGMRHYLANVKRSLEGKA
jgi:carbon monoxide dehydrogenase subunit G